VPDGTPVAPREDDVTDFRASTRPGHRMPHAWLEREGVRVSTYDVVRYGRFTLFAGPGSDWRAVGAEVAEALAIPLDVVTIGVDAEFSDPTGAWRRQREVSERGAVLIRPDQHVAWRSSDWPAEPVAALTKALRTVLARGAAIPVRDTDARVA
jgi:2,4-dichlorophenol 6-monooxygenase